MLRALCDRLTRADVRRFVGVALVVAFACVAVLGAAHFCGAHDVDHHDDCGVCRAVALIGASESFAPPALVEVAVAVDFPCVAPESTSRATTPPRDAAPRAPPRATRG